MNLILGFVSPTGEYFECNRYGHIPLADKLLKEMFNEKSISSPVEELCKHGFVVIQDYFVGFQSNDIFDAPKLTYEQLDWLRKHSGEFTHSQIESLFILYESDEYK